MKSHQILLEQLFTETSEFMEGDSKVKIPLEKGDLGLSLDAPLDDFKQQILNKEKTWDELSKQINTLVIFNKNKHPETAAKAKKIRDSLAAWVEEKRKSDSEFGK